MGTSIDRQDGCEAICGDGVVLGDEKCDPPMQGCDEKCKLEPGWKWSQDKTTAICGDAMVVGKEPWVVAILCIDVREVDTSAASLCHCGLLTVLALGLTS